MSTIKTNHFKKIRRKNKKQEMALPFGKGYCDLNIPIDLGSDPREKLDIVRRALSLGYQTLALNLCIDQKDLTVKGKSAKKKNKDDCKGLLDFPEPPVLQLEESDYPGTLHLQSSAF
jgi:hypothetical protein